MTNLQFAKLQLNDLNTPITLFSNLTELYVYLGIKRYTETNINARIPFEYRRLTKLAEIYQLDKDKFCDVCISLFLKKLIYVYQNKWEKNMYILSTKELKDDDIKPWVYIANTKNPKRSKYTKKK